MGAKKKTKEVVIPFKINHPKQKVKWFIQSGWKFYKKLCPMVYKYTIPSLKGLK